MTRPPADTRNTARPDELWPVWPDAVERTLEPRVRELKDVLDGLAVLLQSRLVCDIRDTLMAFPDTTLPVALNKKQMACKKWLVDAVSNAFGDQLCSVHVLAGWYGVLGALLLNDPRLTIEQLTIVDIDPSCEPVARSLNATSVASGRFAFRVADILALDYRAPLPEFGNPDLIINTSCEHLADFSAWYELIPDGTALALQSNDYRAIPVHVNCVDSVEDFAIQAPMQDVRFAGTLKLVRYSRFMLVGRK